ncbi:MAG: hypothetical protein ACREVX_10505 [Clostridium sp.]|uniref:hypothetical protein n=1 Tax=Clostridium sp. TaxID=1506 RepID=UPI003D6D8430
MKLNKKTTTILSFMIGTVMFTTTAIAQVLVKSGYDQLKDSVKYTAKSATSTLKSYTSDMSVVLKDNNTVLYSTSDISKVDVSKGAKETVRTRVEGSKKTENYSYSDKNGYINKNGKEDIYYTTDLETPQKNTASKNPFDEEGASDMEKIADALIGNLKDAVVVTEKSDGSKTLSGSLSESQIPALINAVVSLQSKRELGYNSSNNENIMPKIVSDVFVKEVKGNMVTTKDGLIKSVLGSGVISGKDEKGVEHKLTFEILAKMTDVNSTKVSKPDLSGKKVEKSVQQDYSKLINPEKYIGKYKTDILVEKDAKFIKIGEKFLDVTAVDDKGISGRYYEQYVKGYEEYATDNKDFKFNAKFEKDKGFYATFNSTGDDSNNKATGYININIGSAGINFNLDGRRTGNKLYDDKYSKIFN